MYSTEYRQDNSRDVYTLLLMFEVPYLVILEKLITDNEVSLNKEPTSAYST
jgi:hypothetical protein